MIEVDQQSDSMSKTDKSDSELKPADLEVNEDEFLLNDSVEFTIF